MSRDFVWAVDENGKPCKCCAKPENRGKRNCKHRAHQEPGQSVSEFFNANGINKMIDDSPEEPSPMFVPTEEKPLDNSDITQEEIDNLAARIDEICGCRVTEENYDEVINSLSVEQLDQLNKLGFEAAPEFSLPVTDENYQEVNNSNKIYFAELPDYHIGGKVKAINDMYGAIGPSPFYGGEEVDIKGNYREGLTDREYFERQFGVRSSQVQKTSLVNVPGHAVYVEQELDIIKRGSNKKLLETQHIKWKDIEVGDMFIDGSTVLEKMPISEKPCIVLTVAGSEPVIVSEEHMMKFDIYNKEFHIVNDRLLYSAVERKYLMADTSWVCARDIYDCHKRGMAIIDEKGIELVSVERYKKSECFCIRTDTGKYVFNGITHHNCARLLFYGMSDIEVIEDCGGDHSKGIMGCKAPGVCKKCAEHSHMHVETGSMVGGVVSTHMTEGLTQASLSAIHTGVGNKQGWEVIADTLRGYKTSPIISEAITKETTEEARQSIFEGLKKAYADSGISIDDYNLELFAKQMTQFKVNKKTGQLEYILDGELCDFPSIQTIGGHNNLILQSELSNSYKKIARPQVIDNSKKNSVINISG